jgi:hypothetical protein
VPEPAFGAIAVDTMGGRQAMSVEGFEEYVSKYGCLGWLKGLRDARTLDALHRGGPGDQAKTVHHEVPGAAAPWDVRVQDVFLWHYLRRTGHPERWPRHALQKERDVLIRDAIAEIEADGAPPSLGWRNSEP